MSEKFTFNLNEYKDITELTDDELFERIQVLNNAIWDLEDENPDDPMLEIFRLHQQRYHLEYTRRLNSDFEGLNVPENLDELIEEVESGFVDVSFDYDELLGELKADVEEGLLSMDEDIKIVWDEIEGYRYICDYYYNDCKCKEPHEVKKVKDVITFMEDESSIIKPKLIKGIEN